MSTDLVSLIDGEAVTTSIAIAEGTGNGHKALRELIEDRAAELEQFGVLRFQTAKPSDQGGRPQKYALLSEPQATLLLTFMRNSEVVVRFKVGLVKAFFELRQTAIPAIAVPRTLPEALRAYAREVEAREAAELYAAEMKPKADYVDDFVSPDDCLLFRTVANQINMQEKVLRELLVERKWIYREFIGRRYSKTEEKLVDEYEWRAYAEKKHYFRLFSQHKAPRHHNNQLRQTLYVTPPGEQAIRRLVEKAVTA